MTASNQGVRRSGRLQPNPARPPAPAPPIPVDPRVDRAEPPVSPSDASTGSRRDDGPPPGSRNAKDTVSFDQLPPAALLLARPLLLILAALMGGIVGFVVSGSSGYQATAVLQFTVQGTDNVLVKQSGQTLARNAVAADVLSAAAASRGEDVTNLTQRVTAEWEQDTRLVSVTASASDRQAAVDDANAVASALVRANESAVAGRLNTAADQSNQVLNGEQLTSPDAESARQAQVGSSLGARQDAIASEAGALVIADPANQATAAGVTRPVGTAIGALAGLLLAGLTCLLLGARGLRARSERMLHMALPGRPLSSPSQAAQLAGEVVESGKKTVVVAAAPQAIDAAVAMGSSMAEIIRVHGLAVAELGLFAKDDRPLALRLLRRERRKDLPAQYGADIAVVVVATGSDASALLEGQSDVYALVVVRRGRTLVSDAVRAMTSYERARPTLVLAR